MQGKAVIIKRDKMDNKTIYEKSVRVIAIYRNEPSKFGKPQTKILSDLKEYYVTDNQKLPMLEDVQKGSLVTLKFTEQQNPKYKKLVQIVRVATNTPPAPSKPKQQAEDDIPPFPEALTDSALEAIMDASIESVATYFKMSLEEVKADTGLLTLVGKVYDGKLMKHSQLFRLAMAKREEAEKTLNYRRWKG